MIEPTVYAFRIHCGTCGHRAQRDAAADRDTVAEAARLRRRAVCGQCGERDRKRIMVEPLWTNPLR